MDISHGGVMIEAAVNKFEQTSSASTRSIIRLTWVMIALVAIQTIFLGLQLFKVFGD